MSLPFDNIVPMSDKGAYGDVYDSLHFSGGAAALSQLATPARTTPAEYSSRHPHSCLKSSRRDEKKMHFLASRFRALSNFASGIASRAMQPHGEQIGPRTKHGYRVGKAVLEQSFRC